MNHRIWMKEGKKRVEKISILSSVARRRAGIESEIAHMKSDRWTMRNYYKGVHRDSIGTKMTASAYAIRHRKNEKDSLSVFCFCPMAGGMLEESNWKC